MVTTMSTVERLLSSECGDNMTGRSIARTIRQWFRVVDLGQMGVRRSHLVGHEK